MQKAAALALAVSLALPNSTLALRPPNAGVEGSPANRELRDRFGISAGAKEGQAAGTEAEVSVEGPNGPIVWPVSRELKAAIEFLSSEDPPVDQAAQIFREGLLEAETGSLMDSQGLFFFRPGLFFYGLENLSNPALSLTKNERGQIARAVADATYGPFMNETGDETAQAVFELPAGRNSSLDAWWYFWVRLLVLENRLERLEPRSEMVELHLKLVELLHRMITVSVSNVFTSGAISIEPREFYEERLLKLGQDQPALKGAIGRLLENWAPWSAGDVGALFRAVDEIIPEDEIAAVAPPSLDSVSRSAEEVRHLSRQLFELMSVVIPGTEEQRKAWDYPIDAIAEKAALSKGVVFISFFDYPQGRNLKKSGLPNAWLFQLDLLDRLGEQGFKRWAIVPNDHLTAIQEWAIRLGDARSVEEFVRLTQEYLESRGTPPVRSFFALPQKQETPAVTASIKFLEELLRLKQKHGSETALFNEADFLAEGRDSFSVGRALSKWVEQKREKWLILGGTLLSFVKSPRGREQTLRISQQPSKPHYDLRGFQWGAALSHVVHWIAEGGRGWGDRKSAAVPILGNEPLVVFSEDKSLFAFPTFFRSIDDSDLWVVTAESDEEEEEGREVLEGEDAGSTIPKKFVPAGSAGGLEGSLQAVFDRLLENSKVRDELLQKGWISLEPGQVGALGYQAAGGFLFADSAPMTDAGRAVIADEDLANELAERALAWLRTGKSASEVIRNAKLLNARRGDLLVLEAEPGLTVEEVERLLDQNGVEGAEAARAVLGTPLQVKALPVFAFELFAGREGLPSVIVLSVAVRLQDQQGNSYTLVLMA